MTHSHRSHHRSHRRRGLKRWQKNVIHFGLITGILFALWVEGGKRVDWLFLGLSLITELS